METTTPTASHYLVREIVGDSCEVYALDSMQEALELRDACAADGNVATAHVVLTDSSEVML